MRKNWCGIIRFSMSSICLVNETTNIEFEVILATYTAGNYLWAKKSAQVIGEEIVAAKTGAKLLKFGGDEAVVHFGKHADQIMKITGKSAYNLKNYVDDANWIIQNGTYSSKLNGFYHYMGNAAKGESLFGFVGMKKWRLNYINFAY